MVKKIVVATDGSERSEKAAKFGISLAKPCGASINVISVVDEGSPRDALDIDPYDIEDKSILEEHDEGKKKINMAFVERVVEMAKSEDMRPESEVRIGNPAEEIINYAKEISADLIVLGSHGRGAVATALMGSVAANVLHKGDIPALVVPAKD